MTSTAWQATVLASCATASPRCQDVTIDPEQVQAVADWMCFEVFPPIGGGQADAERSFLTAREDQIDFALVTTAINFAYTDFATGVPWSIEHEGRELVDADGMFLRFEQAVAQGVPVLSGAWLAAVTEEQLAAVLHGPRPIPLLAERVRVLNEIGAVLVERYDGRFSTFVADCPPRAYADGAGLLERLTSEFAQFDDSSQLHGVPIRLDKLPQLGVWTLHRLGLVALEDLDALSVFADYIVPAALRVMRVLRYSPQIAAAVDAGEILPAGSIHENEIRVQTIVACAQITDAINERRADPVVNAQVDYRLWAAFHDLIRPHHLTITTRY